MKKILSLLLITVLVYACGGQSSQTESTETISIDPANIETVEIAVTGMTCNHCEMTIQKAVKALPGVQDVKASHVDEVAIVGFDRTQTTVDEIIEAIADKGYQPGEYDFTEPTK
jgi:copper chaperone